MCFFPPLIWSNRSKKSLRCSILGFQRSQCAFELGSSQNFLEENSLHSKEVLLSSRFPRTKKQKNAPKFNAFDAFVFPFPTVESWRKKQFPISTKKSEVFKLPLFIVWVEVAFTYQSFTTPAAAKRRHKAEAAEWAAKGAASRPMRPDFNRVRGGLSPMDENVWMMSTIMKGYYFFLFCHLKKWIQVKNNCRSFFKEVFPPFFRSRGFFSVNPRAHHHISWIRSCNQGFIHLSCLAHLDLLVGCLEP